MSQTEKPQEGKPTTIYIYPDEWKNYQSLVKEKLGLTAGQRLTELMRKDIAFLGGREASEKVDYAGLRRRHEALVKERDAIIKTLKDHETSPNRGPLNRLEDLINGVVGRDYQGYVIKTLKEKDNIYCLADDYSNVGVVITRLLKNKGSINVSGDDLQLFIHLLENAAERYVVRCQLEAEQNRRYGQLGHSKSG